MKVIIDRFEGDFAVVEVDGQFINMPKALIPLGAKEGDVLTIAINSNDTKARKGRVDALMKDVWAD